VRLRSVSGFECDRLLRGILLGILGGFPSDVVGSRVPEITSTDSSKMQVKVMGLNRSLGVQTDGRLGSFGKSRFLLVTTVANLLHKPVSFSCALEAASILGALFFIDSPWRPALIFIPSGKSDYRTIGFPQGRKPPTRVDNKVGNHGHQLFFVIDFDYKKQLEFFGGGGERKFRNIQGLLRS